MASPVSSADTPVLEQDQAVEEEGSPLQHESHTADADVLGGEYVPDSEYAQPAADDPFAIIDDSEHPEE
jgi:hypothetical protein